MLFANKVRIFISNIFFVLLKKKKTDNSCSSIPTEFNETVNTLENLVSSRMQTALEIGKIKNRNGCPIYDASREKTLIDALLEYNKNIVHSIGANFMEEMIQLMVKETRDFEATELCTFSNQTSDWLYLSIQCRGYLVIGITGDYPPFTIWNDETFDGIEVEMAVSFASWLNVFPVFFKTSWPNLMNDLFNEKYDIGMSGITFTEQRNEIAAFSESYLEDGKCPRIYLFIYFMNLFFFYLT